MFTCSVVSVANFLKSKITDPSHFQFTMLHNKFGVLLVDLSEYLHLIETFISTAGLVRINIIVFGVWGFYSQENLEF